MLIMSIKERAMAATSALQRDTRFDGLPLPDLYARVSRHVPAIEWPALAPDIEAILRLKRERNAVILAHNYQAPEIFHTVADIVGDSLALAREAVTVDADVIVLAGVHFMAETAKLLNPEKTVLIPDMGAGCSLADSITAADVRALKAKYPGVPVVTYVNTSAAVKAESDVCCTSGNAADVVRALGVPRVLMIPDEFLARNVQQQVPEVEMLTWAGHCEVHERFTPDDIAAVRDSYPGVTVIAHPECPPEVVEASDFSGSTAMMMNFVTEKRPSQVVLVTECSMADNIAVANPDIEFIKPCNMCPHMKRMSLSNIRRALETMTHEVTVEPALADRARLAVERMLAVKPTPVVSPVPKA
ncbi:quinolinate synthase A [Methylobacterium brachythecii]|uniref:Quinolinate synthase n=2 Tax=Methylobacterium brachythecii TaxID=1176177 RepID=A0ABQ6DBL8_9HYPH|nr:quinolinate synthase A [Methylobacterium brachythecii]